MKAPKFSTPEGLAAFIAGAIWLGKTDSTATFDWQQILIDFKKHNSVEFAVFYSGMEREKVERQYERFLREKPERDSAHDESCQGKD